MRKLLFHPRQTMRLIWFFWGFCAGERQLRKGCCGRALSLFQKCMERATGTSQAFEPLCLESIAKCYEGMGQEDAARSARERALMRKDELEQCLGVRVPF